MGREKLGEGENMTDKALLAQYRQDLLHNELEKVESECVR